MPDDLARMEEIFSEALAKSDGLSRAVYLDEACAGDAGLRERIEALLAAHEAAGDLLQLPNVDQAADAPPSVSEGPGSTIGQYKLLEEIGEGGFGLVFMAEQEQPVRRNVALKIIKLGMDTRQVVARFESERQALAMMDHPNIAKVFDGGATDTGRPFFVMELIRGSPITEYCDQQSLSIPQRLDLFIQVCQAVQHAHQKGIIHRDLKPSNVLVTLMDDRAVPKIIDFGVAKAIEGKLTDRTLFTGFHQLVGTPAYMSPEQAQLSGVDVDTRSDIYSLGVLLYELLTGTTPFDPKELQEAPFDEMQRIVREVEPPTPSTRLSRLAADTQVTKASARSSDPKRLRQLLRGDLDWIVMKCLEKDRNRRYPTANSLAVDLRHYLEDEPVMARRPTLVYKLRKLTKRNIRIMLILVLCSVVILAALAVVAGSVGWAIRDRQARRSVVEREVLSALDQVRESYEKDKIVNAMALLHEANGLMSTIDAPLEIRDRVRQWDAGLHFVQRLEETQLESVAGSTAVSGNLYNDALAEYGIEIGKLSAQEAVARISQSPIKLDLVAAIDRWAFLNLGDARQRLLAISRAADGNRWRNRFRDAMEQNDADALKELAQDSECLSQPPITIVTVASSLASLGEKRLAIELLRRAQAAHSHDYWINAVLGANLFDSPWFNESAGYLRIAVAQRPDSSAARGSLGFALFLSGSLADAEGELRLAVQLNPDHPFYRSLLAEVLVREGKYDRAEELGDVDISRAVKEELVKRKQAKLAHDDPRTLAIMHDIAVKYRNAGRLAAAIDLFKKTLQLRQTKLGYDNDDTLATLIALGEAYSAAHQYVDAESEFEKCLALARNPVQVVVARSELAKCYLRQGKTDEGTMILQELFRDKLRRLKTPDALAISNSWSNMASADASAAGSSGHAGLYFDGDLDYVILPSLQFDGRPPWTLEAIVKPLDIEQDTYGWTSLVSAAEAGSISLEASRGRWAIDLYIAGTYNQHWVQNYAAANGRRPVTVNEWQHVAGVWDGHELRLYVNGDLQENRTAVGNCSRLSDGPFFLGADPDDLLSDMIAQGFLIGWMRAARISRGVEYTESFTPPEHLDKTAETIGLYDFTVDTGRIAIDRSGHSHHGIIVGAKFIEDGK